MKKNLLSIIILALLLVNIVLTAVMMFSITGTNKKVASLVTDIATVLQLDLTIPGQEPEEEISLADTEIYAVSGPMTLALAPETVTNGKGETQIKQGYVMCNISFSINTKHEDYKQYGSAESITEMEALLKDVIGTVVNRHTSAELQADPGLEELKSEILKAVQDFYKSKFIYKISISDVKYG